MKDCLSTSTSNGGQKYLMGLDPYVYTEKRTSEYSLHSEIQFCVHVFKKITLSSRQQNIRLNSAN